MMNIVIITDETKLADKLTEGMTKDRIRGETRSDRAREKAITTDDRVRGKMITEETDKEAEQVTSTGTTDVNETAMKDHRVSIR